MSTGSAVDAGEGTESKTNIIKKEKTRTLVNEDLNPTTKLTAVSRRPVCIVSTPWPQKEKKSCRLVWFRLVPVMGYYTMIIVNALIFNTLQHGFVI
jgi:hypothetical protein